MLYVDCSTASFGSVERKLFMADQTPSWLRRPVIAAQPVTATLVPTPVPIAAAPPVAGSVALFQKSIAALTKDGSEHGEQMAVFQWVAFNRERFPELKWLYAIPNGGGRSARQGAMLKAEGVKPGVSDLCLPVARHGYHGLYIEMKKKKGVPSDVSASQKEFIAFVQEQGYFAKPAFGWEQAVPILEWYMTPP
jgi:hypothetical protein